MATLVENANRIKNAKESLRQSFINKGVNISSNSKLEDYAPVVNNLDLLSDSTVFKPYSCFVELKDYYVKNGTTVTKKTVDKEKNRFTNFFKEQGSTSETRSKEYYDNYYAFFNGYYLEYGSDDAGTTTTIDTYKYTFSEPDVNGIQYRSSRTYVKSSANFQSQTSTMWSKAAIVKLSDDVGLLSYCRYNYDTYVPDTWYARLFRVATDGTVTLHTAVTTSTASSTTTFKAPFFAMSLRGPNFVFVLKEHDNQNTGVKIYYYHQYNYALYGMNH